MFDKSSFESGWKMGGIDDWLRPGCRAPFVFDGWVVSFVVLVLFDLRPSVWFDSSTSWMTTTGRSDILSIGLDLPKMRDGGWIG